MFGKVFKTLAGNKASSPSVRRRGPSCARCRAPLPGGARRCSRCGTRVASQHSETEVAAPRVPESIGRLEAAILRGALRGGSPSVQVLPSQGAAVGEIKVGSERIFGDEAVRAVAQLVRDGDLAPLEDGFTLTTTGRLRAHGLSA